MGEDITNLTEQEKGFRVYCQRNPLGRDMIFDVSFERIELKKLHVAPMLWPRLEDLLQRGETSK